MDCVISAPVLHLLGYRAYSLELDVFSGDERSRNDDGGNVELKGFVFRLPNPLAWFKDRWYTYRIQSLVDPLFNLREFQVGAKQVCLAVL